VGEKEPTRVRYLRFRPDKKGLSALSKKRINLRSFGGGGEKKNNKKKKKKKRKGNLLSRVRKEREGFSSTR